MKVALGIEIAQVAVGLEGVHQRTEGCSSTVARHIDARLRMGLAVGAGQKAEVLRSLAGQVVELLRSSAAGRVVPESRMADDQRLRTSKGAGPVAQGFAHTDLTVGQEAEVRGCYRKTAYVEAVQAAGHMKRYAAVDQVGAARTFGSRAGL
jgi:hypothetical protein